MEIRPKPLPSLRLDQLGASRGTDDQVKRTRQGMSGGAAQALAQLDLTKVRPSQLDPLAVQLMEEGKLTEEVASELILFRNSGARNLADDRPFNLIEAAERASRVVGSMSPMHSAAKYRSAYDGALYGAKGMLTLINTLRTGKAIDVRA